jgi:5,10-methylenetetrahydrofolate reductase, prokaryotic form
VNIANAMKERTTPFYSLEFFPPKEKAQWPSFFKAVEKLCHLRPLYASVTYGAGGGTQANTLEITTKLKHMGINPMPHLTCVGATREKLAAFMEQLQSMGVDNIMALRGDAPNVPDFSWNKGEFRHASDLVAFVRESFPDFCIGVAGYPGAHPESPTFASDLSYTKKKLDAGADFVVTQLFFDVREYFAMVERLRAMGETRPIVPGILPIQSLESIRRILSLCDANIPGKLYLSLEEANTRGGAEAVKEEGIRFAARQIRTLLDNGAPGIHLYTLNMANSCLRIAEAVGSL